MKLHFIKNENANHEEKFSYFSDYFIYVNEFIGTNPDLPFDNPISLLNKIIFEIQNNIKKSPRFINRYFLQLYFYDSFLAKNFTTYSSVKSFYNIYQRENDKHKAEWIGKTPEFLACIKSLYDELNSEMLDKILSMLLTYLTCAHENTKHSTDIEFCALVLVSIYRLKGFSKNEISEFIDRILKRNIYNFPFPHEFYDPDKIALLEENAKEYFKEEDFEAQFKGLKNVLATLQNRTEYFIYVVDNCQLINEIGKSFKVTFDKVTFISPNHDELAIFKNAVKTRDDNPKNYHKIYPTFFESNKILAYVKLNFDSVKYANFIGQEIIEREIKQLNSYVRSDLHVDRLNYIYISDFSEPVFGGGFSIASIKNFVMTNERYIAAKGNAFETLRAINSSAREVILQNEFTFLKAFSDDELSSYWQYLENLFWHQNKFDNDYDKLFEKLCMAQINLVCRDYLFSIVRLLDDQRFSIWLDNIGLTKEEIAEIWDDVEKNNSDKALIRYSKKIIHPFLKRVVGNYIEFISYKYREKWKGYFSNIVMDLGNYRNADLHSGVVNENNRIKLKSVLPDLVNHIRWKLIWTCEANPSLAYQEILNLVLENYDPIKEMKNVVNPLE